MGTVFSNKKRRSFLAKADLKTVRDCFVFFERFLQYQTLPALYKLCPLSFRHVPGIKRGAWMTR
jgi:hypothetical protein